MALTVCIPTWILKEASSKEWELVYPSFKQMLFEILDGVFFFLSWTCFSTLFCFLRGPIMNGMWNCLMVPDGSHILLDQVGFVWLPIPLRNPNKHSSLQIFLFHVGMMTILVILSFRICSMFKITREDGARHQTRETGSERTPLLPPKDDDQSSWGSSYDSNSQDDEELDKLFAVEGNQLKEGESIKGPQRLCVICFDAPRDCFFLPCGHCAVCFTCGTRSVKFPFSCTFYQIKAR